jgi:hypothetical protein
VNRFASALLACFIAACSRQVIDPAVAGVFDLHSRDGSLLPAPIPTSFDGRTCENEMLSATLTIEPSGHWSEAMLVQHRCSGAGAEVLGPVTSRYAGKFKLSRENSRQIVFTSNELEDEGNSQAAVIAGNELLLTFTESSTMKTHVFVYRRRT